MSAVYLELRDRARAVRRKGPRCSMQTGSLVHEAFLKMVKQDGATLKSRAHFIAIAAIQMRRVLSYAFSALVEPPSAAPAGVDELLARLDRIEPAKAQSPGIGTDLRADAEDFGVVALEADDELVHLCALVRN